MEVGVIGLFIAVVSAIGSFALGRFLSRRRRQKKAERERRIEEAGQSRQVRRQRERQRGR